MSADQAGSLSLSCRSPALAGGFGSLPVNGHRWSCLSKSAPPVRYLRPGGLIPSACGSRHPAFDESDFCEPGLGGRLQGEGAVGSGGVRGSLPAQNCGSPQRLASWELHSHRSPTAPDLQPRGWVHHRRLEEFRGSGRCSRSSESSQGKNT